METLITVLIMICDIGSSEKDWPGPNLLGKLSWILYWPVLSSSKNKFNFRVLLYIWKLEKHQTKRTACFMLDQKSLKSYYLSAATVKIASWERN